MTHTVTSINKFGYRTICLDNDLTEYTMVPGQTFIPHVIAGPHPFEEGQIVTINDNHVANQIGANVVKISHVRTLKLSRKGRTVQQVQVMGRPCRWYAASHFRT